MRHILISALALAAAPALAGGEVNITPEVAAVELPGGGVIQRVQDPDAAISGEFAKIARPCPEFCIQPMSPAEGVITIGELELIALLQDSEAMVIDSRVDHWYAQGTIPGAVHIPYTQMTDHLAELGCEIDFDGWLCEDPKTVALFCNGPWCGQSPTAIRRMIEAGYPAERIRYYRGGMQAWQMLGLTVTGGS